MRTPSLRRAGRAARERIRRTWRTHPEVARALLPWTERAHAVRARSWPREPERPLERVVHRYARHVPDATFVQIGAHDGTQLDPLREAILGSRWRGIMVEPVPYVFRRLEARYRSNPRVILENVAVDATDGAREFHFLAEASDGDDVWRWYDALGSFRREVVLSHDQLVPDIATRLVSMDVPCVTFETLCTRNGIDHVDVVQIDTEGYDREILELVDLERYGTHLVVFEHLHLGPEGRAACRDLLTRHGFELVSDGMDTLAVHHDALGVAEVSAAFEAARAALAGFDQ
jgi:FkbM family methyltransferase